MKVPQLVLTLSGLRVDSPTGDAIVEDVALDLRQGEILGLVGESGSGKTTLALSLFGYARAGAKIQAGQLVLNGEQLRSWSAMRSARGRLISYVPQDSGSALNPSLRVGSAIDDMLIEHGGGKDAGVRAKVLELVGLSGSSAFQRRFPHQLSGGQQQRVSTAIALVAEPRIVVLDEPTTGLDVVTQARLLEELRRLRDDEGVAMLYVSHNLAVVAQIADRIAVMYGGRIVEEGPTETVLRYPRHPYTRGLLSSIPDHTNPRRLEPMAGVAVGVGDRPAGCSFAPRCPLRQAHCSVSMPDLEDISADHRVRCFEWRAAPKFELQFVDLRARSAPRNSAPVLEIRDLCAEYRSRSGLVIAAEDVSFEIHGGECVALVGESGSGKTTIARTIVGLHPVAGGTITLGGDELAGSAKRRTLEQRRRIQIVFQNPSETLNPRHTVEQTICRPLRILRSLSSAEADSEVKRLLELVRLPWGLARRYPSELSGGERQRVAIARALAPRPDVMICDEITSALDVSVQAAVLELLDDLREQLQLSILFISHDLGVVATIADRILVLERGRICEQGAVGAVLRHPDHAYTQKLLAAAPSLSAPPNIPAATPLEHGGGPTTVEYPAPQT
jgi:peptide/nickel transport system ATP-binding protein